MVEGPLPHPPSHVDLDCFMQDDASLALAAALLMEELQTRNDANLAQELQLRNLEAYRSGSLVSGVGRDALMVDEETKEEEEKARALYVSRREDDATTSIRHQIDHIQSTMSKSTIASLAGKARDVVADQIRARQLDQILEAKARKEQLDHEFARVLQREDDEGRDLEEAAQQGLEAALGEARVRELMAAPKLRAAEPHEQDLINFEDKGKGAAAPPDREDQAVEATSETTLVDDPSLPHCSICFDRVRITSNPYSASLEAQTSEHIAFGMYVGPREDGHIACIDCFGSYVENKLDDGTQKVFPVKCFQVNCSYVLTDEDAERALGTENLKVWHYRQLADALPPLYCPNRACSARVIRHDDHDYDKPDAECPLCKTWMCADCQSHRHKDLTCEQYQALPLDERSPEDIAVFELARREGYTRCPGCKVLMELTEGCFHLTCRCGTESCFRCGSRWRREPGERTGRCSRQPPCPLWSEDRLIRAEYRLAQAAPQDVRHPVAVALPGAGARQDRFIQRMDALEFLNGPVRSRNEFSRRMRYLCLCGYCNRTFGSSQALRQHLASLTHSVYLCCNTLYEYPEDLQQHIRAQRRDGTQHAPRRYVV